MEKGELSEIDRQHLVKEPEKTPEQKEKEFVRFKVEKLGNDEIHITIDNQVVKLMKIKWKSSTEWGCPFCSNTDNPQRKKRCATCDSFRYSYGNMDMVYKSPTGGKLSSGTLEILRDTYAEYYGTSTV